MELALVLKIVGWAMTLTPIVVFAVISFSMIMGAARDDEVIMGLVLLAAAIFAIGLIMLILVYFTAVLAVIPASAMEITSSALFLS